MLDGFLPAVTFHPNPYSSAVFFRCQCRWHFHSSVWCDPAIVCWFFLCDYHLRSLRSFAAQLLSPFVLIPIFVAAG